MASTSKPYFIDIIRKKLIRVTCVKERGGVNNCPCDTDTSLNIEHCIGKWAHPHIKERYNIDFD